MYISSIFHVYFMLFVHHFLHWLSKNWPTQRQIPVEYGLKLHSKVLSKRLNKEKKSKTSKWSFIKK